MGQSSWRKKHDPNYGKPAEESPAKTSSDTMRGLVISNPIELLGEAVHLKSSDLDAEELRFSLMYWDKLAWPTNPLLEIAGSSDSLFLEEVGVLSRPVPKPSEGHASNRILHAHTSVFEELDTVQPGQWALSWSERSMSFHPAFKDFSEPRSTLLELHRAIPIPDVDIPLAEILEFKERRRDELMLLRTHFEKLTAEIEASEEPTEKLISQLREVDAACANLVQLGREWQWPVRLGSLNSSVSFEPMKAISSGWAAYLAGERYNLSLPATAAIVGAAALGSVISWKPSDFAIQNIRRPKSPYRYAYSIDAELR
ncbi:DUF6236 family protein [Massilia sp. DD77]|uniref:DUF6236 family protein n=1 Tax=Massilia sp. DD77 TaxID=3109349 RepID=UPI002FFFA4F3